MMLSVRNVTNRCQIPLRLSLLNHMRNMSGAVDWHGTTILAVRKDGKVAMAGDGQVSAGSTVVKGNARKVRRLTEDIVVGFAGSTADAITLLERLEKKLEEYPGQVSYMLYIFKLAICIVAWILNGS